MELGQQQKNTLIVLWIGIKTEIHRKAAYLSSSDASLQSNAIGLWGNKIWGCGGWGRGHCKKLSLITCAMGQVLKVNIEPCNCLYRVHWAVHATRLLTIPDKPVCYIQVPLSVLSGVTCLSL